MTFRRQPQLSRSIVVPSPTSEPIKAVPTKKYHALRTVLSQANGQGLFESHRQVRSGAFAMQRLYATLGLDAGLFVFTVFERDGDADGVPVPQSSLMPDT